MNREYWQLVHLEVELENKIRRGFTTIKIASIVGITVAVAAIIYFSFQLCYI